MRLYNLVLIAICIILVTPLLIYGLPFLVGADKSYTVMGGSMVPALNPGDLILVKEAEPSAINVGDIVSAAKSAEVYTHRVVEKKLVDETYMFKLKGDANEDPDPQFLDASQLIGKVILTIPFSHLYTPYGFFMLTVTPAILLIGKQVYRIYDIVKNDRESPALDLTSLLLFLILLLGVTRRVSLRYS